MTNHTDTSRSDDLVKRLRSLSRMEHSDLSIGDEAADHIEKLEADKARLREALGEIWEWIGNWSPDFIWDDEWPATEAKARAALQETIHDRD